ncbi:hypothetical protein, partial [Paraburkholderia nemoris]|uniref:hypothetical protein n=1 Tax=Paraburkholderia nemoris TaxID=2793076 RepID=UPI001B8CB5CF
EGEKEDPDTHRITHKAGPTGGSEFNANPGSGFRANQHANIYVPAHLITKAIRSGCSNFS